MTPPPNYKRGIGRLSTDRYDFQHHLDGTNPPGFTDFRHDASQIDVVPPIFGTASTVQDSLDSVAAFIAGQAGIGQGFITVGDGYDCWHTADGNINYDSSIPSLNLLLNAIFNPIIANTTVPVGFERIEKGGIVVIKAGTYTVNDTITVPSGITIMGEGFGTKLVNISNLNISSLPPVPKSLSNVTAATNTSPINITVNSAVTGLATGNTVNISGVLGNTAANGVWTVTVISPTQFSLQGSVGNGTYTSGGTVNTMKPMFRIAPDDNRTTVDSAVNPNVFMFARETKILNLVIADNFVENTILGDVYYKLAQNTVGQIPLIEQMAGSYLTVDNVSFLGRYNSISTVTEHAIKLKITAGDTGTILNVRKCFMDGFKVPVHFSTTAGCLSFLEATDNKVRGHGNLNGDTVNANNNCFIFMNDNNATVTGNYFYANTASINNLVYINGLTSGTVPFQSYAKLIIANNQICMDRGSATSGLTFDFLNCNDAVAGLLDTKVTSSVIGNIFEQYSAWSVAIETESTPQLTITKNSIGINVPFTTATTINNTLTVSGNTHLSSSVTTDGYLTSNGIAGFNATATFNGAATLNSDLISNGARYVASTTVTGSYLLNASDHILLVDTRAAGATLNLPTGSVGRTIIVKDRYGSFALHPLTIHRNNMSQMIDDYLGDKIIATNWASITLYNDGTNWLIL